MAENSDKKRTTKTDERDTSPLQALPPDLVEKIPLEVRQELSVFLMRFGPPPHPLARVITSGHVDKVLEQADRDSERHYAYACGNRWFKLIVLIIVLIAVGLVIYGFRDQPTLLTPILTALLGFGAGFGVGKRA